MITVAEIQRTVAQAYDVPLAIMHEPDALGSRSRDHVRPRQIAMALCRQIIRTGSQPISMPAIGRRFGHRDHTTVLHALRAVERRSQDDPIVRATVRLLKRKLVGRVSP